MSFITRYLPRKKMSQLIGRFVHWRGPNWWAELSVQFFVWYYKINAAEAELPLHLYPSIGDLFVRKLKAGMRPIAAAWALHPADSVITEHGRIFEGSLVQAKGIKYKVSELLNDGNWKEKYEGGYWLTYYLCPTDYHRVHCPVTGWIQSATLIPGDLWPVNNWSTREIPRLFAINERAVVEIATEHGPVAVVLVGATNVGSIELKFEPKLLGNKDQSFNRINYNPAIEIKKGDELGLFRMGSTVVVLYSEDFRKSFEASLHLGPVVRVNSALLK